MNAKINFSFNVKDQAVILPESSVETLMKEMSLGKPIKVNGSWWLAEHWSNDMGTTETPMELSIELYLAPDQNPPKMRGFDLNIHKN